MSDFEKLAEQLGIGPENYKPGDDPIEFWVEYIRQCIREGQYCGLTVAADIVRSHGFEDVAAEIIEISKRVTLDRSTSLPEVVRRVQDEIKS